MYRRALVLMTALPPTKGHIRLIEYARCVASEVTVLVSTEPGEPFRIDRVEAIRDHFSGDRRVSVWQFAEQTPQDPATPGFWELWRSILKDRYGFGLEGDVIVASEPYGVKLAEVIGARFIPYDVDRHLSNTKASLVREDPWSNFHQIAEPFQKHLRLNVTIFGAESTGKTTLAKILASHNSGHFFHEWARPYLETVGPEITVESMTAIWQGQKALERHSFNFYDKPVAYFDTDLYSTIGYWEMPHWADTLGPVPEEIIWDARRADLYIICPSNIPFEEDPIRYGGDKREASDAYWISVAEKYELNYVVLKSAGLGARLQDSARLIKPLVDRMKSSLAYDRHGF